MVTHCTSIDGGYVARETFATRQRLHKSDQPMRELAAPSKKLLGKTVGMGGDPLLYAERYPRMTSRRGRSVLMTEGSIAVACDQGMVVGEPGKKTCFHMRKIMSLNISRLIQR